MRATRVSLLAIGAAAAVLAAGAATESRAAAPELAVELAGALTAPGVARDRTAALAVDLETGTIVFRRNPELALAPASTEKLAVSLAALRVLGPRFRFRTEVAGAGQRVGRVWDGDLYLVGYGDPTLVVSDLDALARDVASAGIRHVTGRVAGDERHFDRQRAAPGWKPSFLGIESAPLSALSVGGVERKGSNGSAAAAARAFTAALARRGVMVAGPPGTGRTPGEAVILARDVSKPLAVIVRLINTDSDNFVSEMVLKELGTTIASRGSTSAGARVVRKSLADAGVPLAGVRIVDGSGLSALDRLTVGALVTILRAGFDDPELHRAFVGSLAVAGISGTLKRRLERPPARRSVIAKTGTTRGASALAGFVNRRYVFAILQNGSPVPYWSARSAQDRFVTVLARP
ncbi:MAG TPA: D-alanyl-D-alanine carboxypeptidase/D-alanyl-D-alanine-endopeptidase [Gaiellaceae bacterium]|nr:D-alanyl-D-alanine carboxypeptidase/D-alanyl-D-alanine-endopeptidase [Gaiellaceae bacterium]